MTDGKKNLAPTTAAYLVRTLIRLLLYVAAVFILIRCAGAAYSFGYNVFDEHGMVAEEEGEDVSVIVRETQSVYEVGKMLKEKGLIKDARVFQVQELLYGDKEEIQPGMYVLNTSQNAEQILNILFGEDTEGQPGADTVSETSEASEAS